MHCSLDSRDLVDSVDSVDSAGSTDDDCDDDDCADDGHFSLKRISLNQFDCIDDAQHSH